MFSLTSHKSKNFSSVEFFILVDDFDSLLNVNEFPETLSALHNKTYHIVKTGDENKF